MLRKAVKLAWLLNNRSGGRKSTVWKQHAARVLHRATSLFIEAVILLVRITPARPMLVDMTVEKASSGRKPTKEAVNDLTAYINNGIGYWSMKRWLHPSHIIKLGIADCKNQASLLQAMFERCSIESELSIGVTDRFADEPSVHAWVTVRIGNSSCICDPVVSDRAMDIAEYEGVMRGLIDITPEYLLKEPAAAAYGVGKLSYLRI